MVTIGTTQNNKYTIEAIYNDSKLSNIVKKRNYITTFPNEKKSYIYLGEKKESFNLSN